MRKSILKDKCNQFALRIIRLYKHLCSEKQEFVMSKQRLRSGTSIGANIAEAFYAESELDFVHKLAIAQKEDGETISWLELFHDSGYLTDTEFESINADAIEIMKLLTSSIKTVKAKLNH